MNNYKLLATQAQLVNRYKNTRSKLQKCCANIYFNKQCIAWYNYQTNKGVLTEWFYTKLLQHIGMNNYKMVIVKLWALYGGLYKDPHIVPTFYAPPNIFNCTMQHDHTAIFAIIEVQTLFDFPQETGDTHLKNVPPWVNNSEQWNAMT